MRTLAATALLLCGLCSGCVQIRFRPEPPPGDATAQQRAEEEEALPAEAPSRETLVRAWASAAPRSILVVPAGNGSRQANAPDLLVSTLAPVLAERGYYVFPIHTVKTLLEREGEAPIRPHPSSARRLASRFGADAVLYVTLRVWDADYWIAHTVLAIEADYRLLGKNGELLWHTLQRVEHRPRPWPGSGGDRVVNFLEKAIVAGIARAAPDYLPLTRQLHAQAILHGAQALPAGPIAKAP